MPVWAGNRVRLPTRLRALFEAVPFLAVLVIVLGIPITLLVVYAFRNSTFLGVAPGYTFAHFRDVFSNVADRRLIANSLVALGIVLVSGIASFLVRVYAWGTILGTNGLVNRALELLHVIHQPLGFLFFGYFAIVLTMVYVYLPIATLLMYSAMAEIDPRSLEASRDLGAGRWRTALRTVAPQARSGLLGAFVLTAILAASDYVTPSLVGGIRGEMVGAVIRDTVLINGDFPSASALSVVFIISLMIVLAVLVGGWLGSRSLRIRAFRYLDRLAAGTGRLVPDRVSRTSFSRPATFALLVYLILPAFVVLVFSFNSADGLGLPWRGFTVAWYGRIIRTAGFTDAFRTSVEVAAVAVTVAVLVGLPAAFALRDSRGWLSRIIRAGIFLPYVIPGVMIGAAVITTASDRGLRLGVGPTILVHILLSAPLIILVVYARLVGMDPKIVEAARDLGSTPARAFANVTLPLILPSIIGAALLAVAYSLDELIVTTFTIGTSSTVPIWLFSQAREGFNPGINALGVMLSCGTLIIFAAVIAVLRRTVSPRAGSV
jgi:ABC-type spermidine/putrescine transport system permease subunit II